MVATSSTFIHPSGIVKKGGGGGGGERMGKLIGEGIWDTDMIYASDFQKGFVFCYLISDGFLFLSFSLKHSFLAGP